MNSLVNLFGYYWNVIPKQARYPLLVLLVSIPFVVGVAFFEMSWLIPYQAIAVVTIIVIQIWNAKRSFNDCRNCGHERHMHDKPDLVKKGFMELAPVVCDNYEQHIGGGEQPKNYNKIYWNGLDPKDLR